MLLASILPENFDFFSIDGVPILIIIVAFLLAVVIVRVLKKAIKLAITLIITGILVAWFTGGAVGWDLPLVDGIIDWFKDKW